MKIGDRDMLEYTLIEQALSPFLEEIVGQRHKEIETITRHMEISLNAIIDRVQCWADENEQLTKEGHAKHALYRVN